MARDYLYLRSKLFNTPLCISRSKLTQILSVLGPRLNLAGFRETDIGDFDDGSQAVMTVSTSVAIIQVHGTLVNRMAGVDPMSGMTSYDQLATMFDSAASNPNVSAIIMDIDSGGGEGAGMLDLATYIRGVDATTPVYAVINSCACSAAYGLASAARKIFATEDSIVGSIGVIAEHVDQSKYNEQEGFVVTDITAGAHKADFSPDYPLSDDMKAWLQNNVDQMYTRFTNVVARMRGVPVQQIIDTQAAIYSASDAKTAGLVDEIMPASAAVSSILGEVTQMTDATNKNAVDEAAQAESVRVAHQAEIDKVRAEAKAEGITQGKTEGAAAASALAAEITSMCALMKCPQFAAEIIKTSPNINDARASIFAKLEASQPKISSALGEEQSDARQASTTLLSAAIKKAVR